MTYIIVRHMSPTLPALWIWKGQSITGRSEWPAVQFWSYSIVVGKRTKDDFLLVDSGGQCWRLADINLKQRVTGLHGLLFAVARIWQSPRVRVEPVLEPSVYSLDEVKQEILTQIDKDDDVLTQFTDADKLKKAVQSAQSAAELIKTLKRMKAVLF